MKNYEIKYSKIKTATIYATKDNTISIPAHVNFECDNFELELCVNDLEDSKIGILQKVGDIEIDSKNANFEKRRITIKDINFEQLELDLKGNHIISLENVKGNVDLNIINGEVSLMIPETFNCEVQNDGKNTTYSFKGKACTKNADERFIIEINGKNGTVDIIYVSENIGKV